MFHRFVIGTTGRSSFHIHNRPVSKENITRIKFMSIMKTNSTSQIKSYNRIVFGQWKNFSEVGFQTIVLTCYFRTDKIIVGEFVKILPPNRFLDWIEKILINAVESKFYSVGRTESVKSRFHPWTSLRHFG